MMGPCPYSGSQMPVLDALVPWTTCFDSRVLIQFLKIISTTGSSTQDPQKSECDRKRDEKEVDQSCIHVPLLLHATHESHAYESPMIDNDRFEPQKPFSLNLSLLRVGCK